MSAIWLVRVTFTDGAVRYLQSFTVPPLGRWASHPSQGKRFDSLRAAHSAALILDPWSLVDSVTCLALPA